MTGYVLPPRPTRAPGWGHPPTRGHQSRAGLQRACPNPLKQIGPEGSSVVCSPPPVTQVHKPDGSRSFHDIDKDGLLGQLHFDSTIVYTVLITPMTVVDGPQETLAIYNV